MTIIHRFCQKNISFKAALEQQAQSFQVEDKIALTAGIFKAAGRLGKSDSADQIWQNSS